MDPEFQDFLPVLRQGVQRVIATCCQPFPEVTAPETGTQSHAHPMREICFQLQGKMKYMLGGSWHRIVPGDALFIDSMEEHELYFSPRDRNLKQFWIGLYPKRLNVVFIALDDDGKIRHQLFSCSGNGAAYQILANNWDLVRRGTIVDAEWKKRLLATALDNVLCDAASQVIGGKSFPTQAKREDVVTFICDYIDGNHGNDCALDKLEKLTGFSRYYLSHLYRDYYGRTIGDAVNEARMRFVLSQDWRINAKELAETLGFTSSAIFWKWRRKHRALEETLRREGKNRE